VATRTWPSAAGASARLVSERPELWLPGGLAWLATVGWLPFVVAVVRPPTAAELTFLGARLVTAGAWPWNAVAIVAAVLLVVVVGATAAAAGNAVLIALVDRRPPSPADVPRLLTVTMVSGIPAAIAVVLLVIATAGVAMREFNAPDPAGGPVLGTMVAVAPFLVVLGAALAVGAVFSAIAARLVMGRGTPIRSAVRQAAGLAVRRAPAAHALVSVLAQLLFVAFAAILLTVLWEPIGDALASRGGFDVPTGLLLVGFVAIWLCLVLAGGALHAWSAATWSRLIAAHHSGRT
jgi:hypothetical protein